MVRYIAVKEETTYHDETNVPDKYFHFLSESVEADTGLVFPEIATYKDYAFAVETKFGNSGSIDFIAETVGIGYFLKWALGTVNSELESGATSVYKHEFTPSESELSSFTLEIGSSITARRIFGCKVGSLTIEAPLGDIVTYSIDISGGKEVLQSPATPTTWENGKPFLVFHHGTLKIDDANYGDVKSFSLTISNDLALDDSYRLAGSRYPQLLYSGRRTVEISFDSAFTSTTEYQKLLDSTNVAIELTFDTGVEIETGFNKKMTIELPLVYYTGGAPSISGADEIVVSFSGRAIRDETAGYSVKITLWNEKTDYSS